MLSLPPSVRVFLAVEPADMRKGFDSLAGLVGEVIRQEPLSGHLFVFRNRRGDRIKILYWDRSGYAIWQKRLEVGVFRLPKAKGASVELAAADLTLLLEGVDLDSVRRQPRYVHPAPSA